MTAKDRLGFPVAFGDYVMVADVKLDDLTKLVGAVVRIVKLSETPKGITAVGAYADLVGTGRVSRIPVDIAASRLVMRSNGDALVGTAPVAEDGASYALPQVREPGLGVHIPTTGDAPTSATSATDAATKPEGGRASRTERPKTA